MPRCKPDYARSPSDSNNFLDKSGTIHYYSLSKEAFWFNYYNYSRQSDEYGNRCSPDRRIIYINRSTSYLLKRTNYVNGYIYK